MSQTKWNLDNAHSELQFKVRHLMISNVTGGFKNIAVNVESEGDNFETAKIHFTAETSSIYTGNEQRDGHLKSPEFFDAEQFPTLSFESTNVNKVDDENYKINGKLTMRGVTHPVEFNADFGGIGKDSYGNEKAGFSLTGKVNRIDYGLVWNSPLDTGGVTLGEEVKFNAEIQLARTAV